MKVIIAGSREFDDYDMLRAYCDQILSRTDKVEIVSGGAQGADLLGERYAEERGYKLHRYPAEWEKYGKKAGPLRNELMAIISDALIAFWDGKSRGTADMITKAQSYKLLVRVKQYTSKTV